MKKGPKKSIVCMLIVWLMVITVHVLPVKAYTTGESIKVGEYIKYGTYEDKPILWYVLDKGEEGLLLCQEKWLRHREGNKLGRESFEELKNLMKVRALLEEDEEDLVVAFYLDPTSIAFKTGEGSLRNPYVIYKDSKDVKIFVSGSQLTLFDIKLIGTQNEWEVLPTIKVDGKEVGISKVINDTESSKLTYELAQPVRAKQLVSFSYSLPDWAQTAVASKETQVVLGQIVDASVQNDTVNINPIVITKQLKDQELKIGESKVLTVTAKGEDVLYFEWFKDNQKVHEAYFDSYNQEVSSSYTLQSVKPEDAGRYRVEVSGLSGKEVTTCTLNVLQQYRVTTTSNPYDAGILTNNSIKQDGVYNVNDMATVTASDKSYYEFLNWTENGKEVSRDRAYTFKVTDNRNLVAHFRWKKPEYIPQYTIHVKINPSDAGTVRGDFTYNKGEHVTLKARAKDGYVFDSWVEDGEVVSQNEEYSFTVKQDRWLKANFEPKEKSFKEEWKGLSSRQQKTIKEQFEEYLPYTTLEEELTLDQLGELTKGYFTKKQLREVYRDLDLFEDITDIDLDWKVIKLKKVNDVYFKDLPSRHWAYPNIIELTKKGIVTGYPDYTFRPNQPLTVADTFTFLDRMLLVNNETWSRQSRSTVEKWIEDQNSWAFEHVASISSRLSEKTLKTVGKMDNQYVSRELLAQVLYEATDGKLAKTKPLVAFTDTLYSEYKDGINYCIRTGLLEGTTSYTMEPGKPVTRAEMMTILQRLNKALNK